MLSLARGLCRHPQGAARRRAVDGPRPDGRDPAAARRCATPPTSTGTAVLLVEQHVRQALRYADRAYVMRRGRIELSGSATELGGRLAEIEDSYLTERRRNLTDDRS